MDDLSLVRRLLIEAQHDPAAQESRVGVGRALTVAFREVGRLLWAGGFIIAADRVEGVSPFECGSDATVGLATVAQIAGELCAGTMLMLEANNSYGACALLRQLVEVEYLAWAFAEDESEAAAWLRSSKDDRLQRWQPRHLRDRSGGRFRAGDYGRHCEMGGHPTPEARLLLPDHSVRLPDSWWWMELATHGASGWDYLLTAAQGTRYGYGEEVAAIAKEHRVAEAIASWHDLDRLAYIAGGAVRASTFRDPP